MKRAAGFTLIEVIVAVTILGTASVALLGLFGRSIDNIRRVEDLRRYQLAGEEVMNRVLLLPSLPGEGQAGGRLERLDGDWRVRVHPWIPDDLRGRPDEGVVRIEVEIGWDGRSNRRSLKLETIRPSTLYYDSAEFRQAIEAVFP